MIELLLSFIFYIKMLERIKKSRDYNDYEKILACISKDIFLSSSFNFSNYIKVLLNDKNFNLREFI